MKIKILLSFLILSITPIFKCHASSFLTPDKIEQAQTLAQNTVSFEDYRTQESPNKCDWLTLEPFAFTYKDTLQNFCLTNGQFCKSKWGEIAVYAGNVDMQKIKYSMGQFSDLSGAAFYLATLQYEYIPATDSTPAYFIVEHVNAGYKAGGKGYSQACLAYFINEFVPKRTNVTYVFSDLRNGACRHYFPRCNFQPGVPEIFKEVKFERPMHYPYFWIKQEKAEEKWKEEIRDTKPSSF